MAKALKNRDLLLGLVLIALVLAIAARFPGYITPTNLEGIFTDTSILIILALGQMLVILTRCIDLSVASNLALTGMIVAMVNAGAPDLPLAALVLLSALIGLGLGSINGVLVWTLGIPPIVVTLGTLAVYRGVIFVVSDGEWVNAHEMSEVFLNTPRILFLGLPILAWVAILFVLIVAVFLRWTRTGRAFLAVGGNPTAAVYAGLDVGRTQFLAFSISGLLSGICGYLWVSRYAVAYVDVARGFELEVVAACVIGGVSIAGGIGTVTGVVLGALFLGAVKNALPVIGISPFWQLAISGTVIIVAVVINARQEKTAGKLILRDSHRTH
ncbi:MAG: ABC transporter permease [Alphaproteobacteria bacterium]|nr:ABC transporter permease [Alphaproteobacteria bacterium]